MTEPKIMETRLIKNPFSKKREVLFPAGVSPCLFLLEVDPLHFYAYWELSQDELAILVDQAGDFFQQSTLTLRVYEGEESSSIPSLDIALSGWKNRKYIDMAKPDTSYYAELGLKSPQTEEFLVIKGSNMIKTPKNIMCFSKQEQWMMVLGQYEEIKMVRDNLAADPSSLQSSGLKPALKPLDTKIIEQYYSNLTRGQGQLGVQNPDLVREEKKVETRIKGESQIREREEGEEWEKSAEVELGPWGGMMAEGGAIFSYFQAAESPSSSSFLHYEVDMVIYGKVQPGDSLFIDDVPVETSFDGSFSWRVNIRRERDYKIPLRVVSKSGQEISELMPFYIKKL